MDIVRMVCNGLSAADAQHDDAPKSSTRTDATIPRLATLRRGITSSSRPWFSRTAFPFRAQPAVTSGALDHRAGGSRSSTQNGQHFLLREGPTMRRVTTPLATLLPANCVSASLRDFQGGRSL